MATDGITLTEGYLEVPGNRGIGVFVDASRLKRFVVRKDVVTGHGGRIRVRCYDENGVVLSDMDAGHPFTTGMVFATPYFATRYTFNHMHLDETLRDHVSMGYYEAGHMMYVKLSSLGRLKADLATFIQSSSK